MKKNEKRKSVVGKDKPTMQLVSLTLQDIWNAMRGNVYRNKKKYSRKTKHSKDEKKDY